jgi:hypothetical protein
MIDFSCSCGAAYRVADAMAGQRARCPKCQAVGAVPAVPAVPTLTPIVRAETPTQRRAAEYREPSDAPVGVAIFAALFLGAAFATGPRPGRRPRPCGARTGRRRWPRS